MSNSERQKGLRGQQEVTRLFRSHGIALDKLAAQGDRVWYLRNGTAIRLEVKNHGRIQMGWWIKQADEETPSTMTPAVVWKHEGRWRLDIDLEDYLAARGA